MHCPKTRNLPAGSCSGEVNSRCFLADCTDERSNDSSTVASTASSAPATRSRVCTDLLPAHEVVSGVRSVLKAETEGKPSGPEDPESGFAGGTTGLSKVRAAPPSRLSKLNMRSRFFCELLTFSPNPFGGGPSEETFSFPGKPQKSARSEAVRQSPSRNDKRHSVAGLTGEPVRDPRDPRAPAVAEPAVSDTGILHITVRMPTAIESTVCRSSSFCALLPSRCAGHDDAPKERRDARDALRSKFVGKQLGRLLRRLGRSLFAEAAANFLALL